MVAHTEASLPCPVSESKNPVSSGTRSSLGWRHIIPYTHKGKAIAKGSTLPLCPPGEFSRQTSSEKRQVSEYVRDDAFTHSKSHQTQCFVMPIYGLEKELDPRLPGDGGRGGHEKTVWTVFSLRITAASECAGNKTTGDSDKDRPPSGSRSQGLGAHWPHLTTILGPRQRGVGIEINTHTPKKRKINTHTHHTNGGN